MKNTIVTKLISYIFYTIMVVIFVFATPSKSLAYSSNQVLDLVNKSRASEGLSNLTINPQLTVASDSKAHDMFDNGYFAHISPTGKTPWDFIKKAGYDYSFAGENLAIGYTNVLELHTAWMNSPSHRENIMNPNFKEIGIAVVEGEYEGVTTTVAVQMFGKQSLSKAKVESSNINPSIVLNKEKSGFSPTKIFVNETVNFKVTFTGEAEKVLIYINNKEIDLLSSSKIVEVGGEKTIEVTEKITEIGDLPVQLTIIDKDGGNNSLNLGKISVLNSDVQKTMSTTNNDSNWKVSLALFGAIFVIGIFAFAFVYKFQKRIHIV